MIIAEWLKANLASSDTADQDTFLQNCLHVGGVGTENVVVRPAHGSMGIPGGGPAYTEQRSTCEERLRAIRGGGEPDSPTASESGYDNHK